MIDFKKEICKQKNGIESEYNIKIYHIAEEIKYKDRDNIFLWSDYKIFWFNYCK
jgi:hypothetical protein